MFGFGDFVNIRIYGLSDLLIFDHIVLDGLGILQFCENSDLWVFEFMMFDKIVLPILRFCEHQDLWILQFCEHMDSWAFGVCDV